MAKAAARIVRRNAREASTPARNAASEVSQQAMQAMLRQHDQEGYERRLAAQTRYLKDLEAQVAVLQSDRDRFTAAIESLSRRLTSPDGARGTWPAALAQTPVADLPAKGLDA